MAITLMAEYTTKRKELVHIFRNSHGKWNVRVDGMLTQNNLNASEIVRYLANALEGK